MSAQRDAKVAEHQEQQRSPVAAGSPLALARAMRRGTQPDREIYDEGMDCSLLSVDPGMDYDPVFDYVPCETSCATYDVLKEAKARGTSGAAKNASIAQVGDHEMLS